MYRIKDVIMITKLATLMIFISCLMTSLLAQEVAMMPFVQATQSTQTYGFQTYGGTYIGVAHLKSNKHVSMQAVGSAIQDGLLELKSGDIFYQEELEYIAIPKGEFTGASGAMLRMNPLFKAPHNPK